MSFRKKFENSLYFTIRPPIKVNLQDYLAMSKTFKRVFKIIGYLMLVSLIILYISEPSGKVYQLWFLCLSLYIQFYVYYAEKKGKIYMGSLWNPSLNDTPKVFRFCQLFYMIFAISIFASVVTQLTEG